MSALTEILARKTEQVADDKNHLSLDELKDRLANQDPRYNPRQANRFIDAIISSNLSGKVALIAEFKRRSPSAGEFDSKMSRSNIITHYQKHGATALSILTDGPYFNGSVEDVTATRSETTAPILRKEFIVDPYQIYESKYIGADAILLIAKSLSAKQLQDWHGLASSLGLAILVEIHDESEINNLTKDMSCIGINNRNLDEMKVDTKQTLRLLPLLPKSAVAVSESGIHSMSVAKSIAEAGAHAMLLGESLLRSESLSKSIAEFSSIPYHATQLG